MATDVMFVPVSYLTGEARSILGHLNARRLFVSDGAGRLPRDVRGLANLFGFSAQESENLSVQSALEMWIRRNEPSATVHLLLRYLEIIDRYDIRDDLQKLAAEKRLIIEPPIPENVEAYTTDDLERGFPQFYDALVIYAEEDCIFAEGMFNVMQKIGFKLFKKHSLEPGYMKQEAMAEMIDTRCRYTILVFSSAFFKSLDEKFYSQYVHAKQIADKKRHMIPVVYQKCEPLKEFRFYTTLQVADSQFWRRLALNLNNGRSPRLEIPSWLASVDVTSANILPTLHTIRINEYNPPRDGNETCYRSEPNRQANSLSQGTNAFVTSDNSHVNGHSSQHNDVFVANRIPNRPVADQIYDESSNQSTNASNGSIVNRQVTDAIANTNSQDAEAQIRPQPAYEYLVSVQIVADHFGEHPNITDPEPTQSSTSNILQDQTANSQSSLLNTSSSATQSSLCSTSYIPNDQTVNSQSSLLTSTSSFARCSVINNLARWCRDRPLWVARHRLFQIRTRRAK